MVAEIGLDSDAIWKTVSASTFAPVDSIANAEAVRVQHRVVRYDRHRQPRNLRPAQGIVDFQTAAE
jgi:hypothetical protein